MIGIVTVNWNAYEITVKFAEQLLENNLQNFTLVIVNNSPEEDTAFDQTPLCYDPKIQLIHAGANLGYSGGLNLGIKTLMQQPEVRQFLLMNNDVEFDKDFLQRMSLEGNDSNTIYSPVVMLRDTVLVQNTGGAVHLWLGGAMNLNKNVPIERIRKRKPDFLSGCILFMERPVVEKVGFFDEIYGSYWEDVDYCYRAKRLGIRLEVLWDVTANHFHSYSTKGNSDYKSYLLNRNQILFAKKHLTLLPRILFSTMAIVRGFIQAILTGRMGSYFQGVKEGFGIDSSAGIY